MGIGKQRPEEEDKRRRTSGYKEKKKVEQTSVIAQEDLAREWEGARL